MWLTIGDQLADEFIGKHQSSAKMRRNYTLGGYTVTRTLGGTLRRISAKQLSYLVK